MTTSFPTGLDALTNPTGASSLTSPDHAGQHADANDAIEALEAKVGVNSSAVTTSLDYLVRNIDANNGIIQIRRDTAANWISTNPTLAAGEMGLETDTGKSKIGTGSTRTYNIGDVGPAGGKIFITPSTAGNSTGKYFEVAPVEAEVQRTWATGTNDLLFVAGADGITIGTGAQNTIDIVAQSGNVAATCAASYCSDLVFGGYSDWFLPSKDELNQMYVNGTALNTSFRSNYYWSSTEASYGYQAWTRVFNSGDENEYYKGNTANVRPVRAFTATSQWEYIPYVADVNATQGYSLRTIIDYPSSSTFNIASYPWARYVEFLLIGAGGGGAGLAATGVSQASIGGGGGAGGVLHFGLSNLSALSAGALTISIGAQGSGAAAGANNGSNGGDTSITGFSNGASATATGGSGGISGGLLASTTPSGVEGSKNGAGTNTLINNGFTINNLFQSPTTGGFGTNGAGPTVSFGSGNLFCTGGGGGFFLGSAGKDRTVVTATRLTGYTGYNLGTSSSQYGGGAGGQVQPASQAARTGLTGQNGFVRIFIYE